jgi:acyl dehydratase
MLDMAVPKDRIHLEDLEIGRQVAFGRFEVPKEDIIRYARAFDPQLIHLDEEAAKASIVGGLCASGFHSCAMLMRMLADDLLAHATSLGSPGIDDVRWMRPVRPGDVLSARMLCTEKRALASRPGVGIARLKHEMLNQKGEVLMSWDSNQLLRVRHSAAAPSPERGSGAGKPAVESLWDLPGPEPRRDGNFFEDRNVGETYSLGSETFTREATVAFAREFDPQPFHLDDAAAKASLFGALSASGWHTTAVWIRQYDARSRSDARPVWPLARLQEPALAEAGLSRRHDRVPRPDRREARLEEPAGSRPHRDRQPGPQPKGRDRLRHPRPDLRRAPHATCGLSRLTDPETRCTPPVILASSRPSASSSPASST